MDQVAEHFGWIEILFVAAIAFGFGLYQLWSVNREIARDKEAKAREQKDRQSDQSRHPVGEHELDDR